MLQELALSTLSSPHQHQTEPLPNLSILPFDQPSINNLDKLQLQFANANLLQFYTDGSLTSLGSSNCQMGIVWLQTDQN